MVLELREKVGKKYTLLLNGERYCRCYPGDLHSLGFTMVSEGQETEISKEVLESMERTLFLPRARRRALLLLGKKEYTRREMEKKLVSDGYPEQVVLAVLLWLSELRYIEDRSYAERYAFHLLTRCSEREIVQKMQQKGFDRELIKDALEAAKEAYCFENKGGEAAEASLEHEAIRAILQKKGYSPENAEEEKKKRLVMSLYRKGFSLSDIRAVIGEFETDGDC